MAVTSALQVSVGPSIVTTLGGVTLHAIPSTTPVAVLVGDVGETLLPIVSPVTDSTSLFGLGSGSVATGDKLMYKTLSGDSSGLTINADGTWSWSTLPGEDVVVRLRVWDSGTGLVGTAGEFTFAGNGTVYALDGVVLRPEVLTVVTLPTDLNRNAAASITLDNLALTPTLANTRIFLNEESGIELTSFSIVQNTATRFTFNVTADVAYLYGEYPLLIVVDEQFIVTDPVHYRPAIGNDYVNVTTPVTDQAWSVFYNYTGDAPVGGQLEWDVTTGEAGITVQVQGDGSVAFTYTDTNNTTDVVISDRIILDVRHIDATAVAGSWGTFTYLATQMVLATFDSAWHSDMYVSNTFSSEWDVYNEASQTFDSAWDVYNTAMRTFNDAWDISQYVRQDFESTWLFAGTVRAEFVSTWDVEEALPEMVTVQFASRWNVEAAGGPLTVAFESAWNIERIVTATFSSRWNSEAATVGSDVGNDLAHRMIIVGEDRTMKIG